MTKIYHLALVKDWQAALKENAAYYPPTYETDGFVHGTSEVSKLLEVANHFYTGSKGDWLCLEMTEETLGTRGIEVKYEPPAAVGDQDGSLTTNPNEEAPLFPHIFGGIHPDTVTATYSVTRDGTGRFLAIDVPDQ